MLISHAKGTLFVKLNQFCGCQKLSLFRLSRGKGKSDNEEVRVRGKTAPNRFDNPSTDKESIRRSDTYQMITSDKHTSK